MIFFRTRIRILIFSWFRIQSLFRIRILEYRARLTCPLMVVVDTVPLHFHLIHLNNSELLSWYRYCPIQSFYKKNGTINASCVVLSPILISLELIAKEHDKDSTRCLSKNSNPLTLSFLNRRRPFGSPKSYGADLKTWDSNMDH